MQDKLGFPDKAEQHSAEPLGEESGWPRLDDIRVCGIGVRVAQWCYACQMLTVEYAQAPFSQVEPADYPMLSLVMHVYYMISWDIPA